MQVYKTERSEFGRFYYRFPQGEAGLDVYDRVSLFIGTLFRWVFMIFISFLAYLLLVFAHLFYMSMSKLCIFQLSMHSQRYYGYIIVLYSSLT